MTYPILCDGPGPHDPADGVLGESSIEHTTGMRCAAPKCQPVGDDTVEATAVTVDAAAIDAALAAAQKATTVAALRAAVVALAQQLQSS